MGVQMDYFIWPVKNLQQSFCFICSRYGQKFWHKMGEWAFGMAYVEDATDV